MKNLLLTAIVAGLVVLGWHPGNGVRAAAERNPMRAVAVETIRVTDLDAASVRIDHAVVENEMLIVGVTYAGGCKVHDFKLVSDGVDAVLTHQNYGDTCETTVSESLRFDLSTIKGTVALPPLSVSDLPRS